MNDYFLQTVLKTGYTVMYVDNRATPIALFPDALVSVSTGNKYRGCM
jgi:hypothetical protein